MAFCTQCGHDLENGSFCVNCGVAVSATGSVEAVHEELKDGTENLVTTDIDYKVENNKKSLFIALAVAAAVVLFVISIASARHWEKIDVPAHAETFHSETYLTGNYDVANDHVSPCWVGQNWYQCINSYVGEYNAVCTSGSLTSNGRNVCSAYLSMIDDMKSQGNSWSYVSSLGGNGRLSAVPEEATKQVSNNDYRPAKTHEAVCYLGFIGECE